MNKEEYKFINLKVLAFNLVYIVIFTLLVVFIPACTFDSVNSDQLFIKNALTCTKSDSLPFTGVCRDLYENGEIKSERNYKNGILDGSFVRYYKNGQVSVEVNYSEGSPVDGFKQYYENGKLKAEKVYNGNSQVLTRWFENGVKTAEIHFENNMLNGRSEQWYKNGKQEMQANYRNDKHEGQLIAWHSNGNKKIEGKYVDDKLDGKWTQWNEEGNVIAYEYYKNGYKDSTWEYYFDNGKKRLEIVYRNGLIKRNTEWNERGDRISNFEAE